MARSLGFGSSPNSYDALLTLAFATPPGQRPLDLELRTNSLAHSSIGTPSPPHLIQRQIFVTKCQRRSPSSDSHICILKDLEKLGVAAPTPCKHIVSGTISLPYSGYFSSFPHGTCSLSVRFSI